MEAYPADYVAHNLPLLVLSGLGEESQAIQQRRNESLKRGHGVKISSELAQIAESKAALIREEFLKVDGSELAWNSSGLPDRPELVGYKMTCTGRVGTANAIARLPQCSCAFRLLADNPFVT